MQPSRQLWKLAACSLVLAACAPVVQHIEITATPPVTDGSVLIVRNDYVGTMEVYAITGNIRTAIGTVRAGATATFPIPRRLLMRPEIQLQVDPVGPVAPFTYQPIAVGPAKVIELSVAPSLQMSSYAVVFKNR